MRPKWDQRQTKILKPVLKTVLEPSWADLGLFRVPSWDRKIARQIGENFEQVRLQEAPWMILGRFGRPGGSKMGPAEGLKWCQVELS